jgi:BlaI family penicillinase repressor
MRLSDTEWIVMRAVWSRSPTSAREIHEAVSGETGWAYTTLKTLLARLVEKGVLSERKRANTSVYEPLVSERDARGSALRSLVDRAFDGAFGTLLQHLVTVERLSARDRAALDRLLAEADAVVPAPAPRPRKGGRR